MNKYFKRILPLLITLALAWFLFQRGIRWNDLRSVLVQAQWGWLALALAWQAGTFCALTWLNGILLQRYGAKISFGKQFVIQLVMAFIEAVLPSASISGLVLRARLLKPHSVSPDVATATTLASSSWGLAGQASCPAYSLFVDRGNRLIACPPLCHSPKPAGALRL